MWPVIMAVFCYHAWQLLFLAWYSLTLDLTIFHPEPALLLVVLTTQRRPSPTSVYMYPKKESEVSNCKGMVSNLITSKEQILANYSDVFDGIGCFTGPPYHIQVDPSVTPKQSPSTNPSTSKKVFQERDQQDVTSQSFEACKPSNSLEQQFFFL